LFGQRVDVKVEIAITVWFRAKTSLTGAESFDRVFKAAG